MNEGNQDETLQIAKKKKSKTTTFCDKENSLSIYKSIFWIYRMSAKEWSKTAGLDRALFVFKGSNLSPQPDCCRLWEFHAMLHVNPFTHVNICVIHTRTLISTRIILRPICSVNCMPSFLYYLNFSLIMRSKLIFFSKVSLISQYFPLLTIFWGQITIIEFTYGTCLKKIGNYNLPDLWCSWQFLIFFKEIWH